MADKIDIALWQQCVKAVPRRPVPARALPFRCRDVDGNRVFLIDGDLTKIRPDKSGDEEHPHIDFVEGANDMEAGWVRREFGKNVLLLDDDIHPQSWPFVLYHEAYERRHMAKGMSYNRAHVRANDHERRLRMAVRERMQQRAGA